jgi:hypothetical protein
MGKNVPRALWLAIMACVATSAIQMGQILDIFLQIPFLHLKNQVFTVSKVSDTAFVYRTGGGCCFENTAYKTFSPSPHQISGGVFAGQTPGH